MKFGVLGTGMVGNAIGSKLIQLGHEVKMGSRTPDNEKAAEWGKQNGSSASQGTFKEAASFGEIVFNCTAGAVSLEALAMAGAESLNGKIIVDVSNPLIRGNKPSLVPSLSNTTSLGEEIQRAYPKAKVVKTLNTMHCNVMVDPALVSREHDVFICGDDNDAKTTVTEILNSFGWISPTDLGDLSAARATEMLSIFGMPHFRLYNSPYFNLKVVK
jgi:8-hydroxy-5-deazaflavin:NADPH oxidoreductase